MQYLRVMRRAGLLMLSVLCVAACSSSSKNASPPTTTAVTTPPSTVHVVQTPDALKAVAITSCAANAKHEVEIAGTVENATSARASFTVQIAIRNRAGARLFATAASATDVAPGASARWNAVTTAPFTAGTTCSATGLSTQPSS